MTEPTRHLLFSNRPIERKSVETFVTDHGLRRLYDDPLTNGLRQSTWVSDTAEVSFAASAPSGCAVFVVIDNTASLQSAISDAFDTRTPAQVLADAEQADSVQDRIAAVFQLSTLALALPDNIDDIYSSLAAYLGDDTDLVRWAAAERLQNSTRPDVLRAFESAAETNPELAPYVSYVRERVAAEADGTLHDGPTDSWHELLARAKAGVEAEQWTRVERAMDALLDSSPDHTEGLYFRALAYEQSDKHALAVGLLAAAAESVRYRSEEDIDADLMAKNEVARERVNRLLDERAVSSEEAREVLAHIDELTERSYPGCAAAIARELVGRTSEDDILFRYTAGAYDRDVDLLESVLDGADDSPDALYQLAQAVRDDDPARADELLGRTLGVLDAVEANAALSADAARIATRAGSDAIGRADVVAAMTRAAYQAQDYERAGALADEWVELDPTSLVAWQIRPNARTFALEHEAAARLYPETLAALEEQLADPDGFLFGDDPLPGMHFNYSCVLSKVGRYDEALDELRLAVRMDETWAERALEDDYFAPLMDHPEFVAITSLDPQALIPAGHLSREHIERLVTQALGESYGGDVEFSLEVGEEAAMLAEAAAHDDLLVRALNVMAWTHTFYGDPGQGLELVERAVRIAIDSEDVDDGVVSESHQYHAEALQAVGMPEAARAAFERALELKVSLYGDDHPYVAKVTGGMARLAAALGEQEQARQLLHDTIARLEGFLAAGDTEDEAYADALADHPIALNNLGHRAYAEQRDDDAFEHLSAAVESLERLYDADYSGGRTVEHAQTLAESLIDSADREQRVTDLRVLIERLDDLTLSSVPEVRKEQKFWNGIRNMVRKMRSFGITGDIIAGVLSDALRGTQDPAVLQSIPELGHFGRQLAHRVNEVPTLLVTSALALETAQATGEVEQAIEDLAAICIAAVWDEVDPA